MPKKVILRIALIASSFIAAIWGAHYVDVALGLNGIVFRFVACGLSSCAITFLSVFLSALAGFSSYPKLLVSPMTALRLAEIICLLLSLLFGGVFGLAGAFVGIGAVELVLSAAL